MVQFWRQSQIFEGEKICIVAWRSRQKALHQAVRWAWTGRRAADPEEAHVPFQFQRNQHKDQRLVSPGRNNGTCSKSGKPLPKCWKASLTMPLKDIAACNSSASTMKPSICSGAPCSLATLQRPTWLLVKCASRISDFFSTASDVSVVPDPFVPRILSFSPTVMLPG